MGILENWQQWTSFLGNQVQEAKEQGMNKGAIDKTAVMIGEYLAQNVEPKNEQERVLKELWSVASNDEKKSLASCVVKLVSEKPLQ